VGILDKSNVLTHVFSIGNAVFIFPEKSFGARRHIGEIVEMQGWDENHLNF